MSTSEIAKLESRWRENRQGLSFAPLAEAYRKMGDPTRALEVLNEGLAVNPNYIPASIVLGRCHLDLGDDHGAEAAFAHVLELDLENVIALRALADIAERAGRLGEAQARLQSLLAVDRGNEEARTQLARLEERLSAGSPGAGAVPEPAASAVPWDDEPADESVPESSQATEPASAGTSLDGGALGDSFAAVAPEDETTVPEDHADDEPVVAPDHPSIVTDRAAEAVAEESDALDWIPEPEPFVAAEVEVDRSIELQEHLTPDEAVEPLEDLVVDDAPVISDASADAEAMTGLVGQDFEEHSAGVVPLEDLKTGAGSLNDFDDLERVSELDLTPADSNEFQVPSAADELASRVQPDDFDTWIAGAEPPADFPPIESVESAELPQASTPAEFETVAGAFGSDALGDNGATADDVGALEEPVLEEDSSFEAEPLPAALRADSAPDDEPAWEDEDAPDAGMPELVVTESMADLYLRQGHRKEALAVYRLLYQRTPDDLRLRERVDELETSLAAEMPGVAEPAEVVSLVARDEGHTVTSFFRKMLGTIPGEPPRDWQEAVAPPARGLDVSDREHDASDAAPTRPAGDHLSLSDVFGEEGSPVPPAVRASAGPADDDVSFDAFFGDASGEQARSRPPARVDDDLDQFQSWLQNLKR